MNGKHAEQSGGVQVDIAGFNDEPVSLEGSSRGTGYIESNKILMARGKLHVAWLNSGRGEEEDVCVRTRDLGSGQWSDVVVLGKAVDNHGGPALVRDSDGYLHTLFGPHGHPFSYRRSVRPDDASEWTPVEHVGRSCTYPGLVCAADNTLHMVCRESAPVARCLVYYRRTPDGRWSEARPLIEPTNKDGSYRCYRGSLYIDEKGVIHLGFMLFGGEHFRDAKKKGLAGYLRSADGGDTWTLFDGTVVENLPVDDGFDRIPVTNNCIRTSNIVVGHDGAPCIVSVSTGFRGYDEKWGEAVLWRRMADGWQAVPLNPYIEKVFPGHRASWCEPSLSISGDGRLFAALVVVDATAVDPREKRFHGAPASIYGNGSSRIMLMVSKDGGQTFDGWRVGKDVTGVASWIPCMERLAGHNKMNLPRLIYTHGVTAEGCRPKDAVTEIRMVSPHS